MRQDTATLERDGDRGKKNQFDIEFCVADWRSRLAIFHQLDSIELSRVGLISISQQRVNWRNKWRSHGRPVRAIYAGGWAGRREGGGERERERMAEIEQSEKRTLLKQSITTWRWFSFLGGGGEGRGVCSFSPFPCVCFSTDSIGLVPVVWLGSFDSAPGGQRAAVDPPETRTTDEPAVDCDRATNPIGSMSQPIGIGWWAKSKGDVEAVARATSNDEKPFPQIKERERKRK